jgi:hypothetical protein
MRHTDGMDQSSRAEAQVRKRLDRLENIVLAIAGKVKKMAERFEELQQGVTGLGGELRGKLKDLVAAHDSGNAEAFESEAGALDDLVNKIENLGAPKGATKGGQSPSPAVDLKQNAGPTEPSPTDQPSPPQARASAPKGDEERDVVVKGREMPD